MLNVLLCYLHILVYILNIHEPKSTQVGHLHCPSQYAAFYTILNASARHIASPLATLAKGQLFCWLSYVPVIACHLGRKRDYNHI